nr:hypothetical protein [Sedimentibacter sp.]
MFKIIKYDFIRKYKLVLITFILAILLNILAIAKSGAAGSGGFLVAFPILMVILYIGDIIKMYSDDLNKRSGYMLFMTSNSGYKIIVSKVITAILEGITILLLYLVFILINSVYISYAQGFQLSINMNEVIRGINQFLSGSLGFNLGHVFVFLVNALILSISFILTAYTAITIRKSIFSEVKLGGILSFVIFVAINWITSYATGKLMSIMSPYYDSMQVGNMISATQLLMALLPIMIISTIESIIMIIGSGYLLEKKINL